MIGSHHRIRRTREQGFTLIEMLAALAVGSVVIVAVAALVHNVALNFDRGTGLAGKADQLLLAVERMAADLGSARLVAQSEGANAGAAFAGDASQVRFIAAGVAASGSGGEEVVSLTVEDGDDVSRLVRRRAPWLGLRMPFESVALRDPVELIQGKIDIAFAFGTIGVDGGVTWSDDWRGHPLLPRLVRLTVRDRASGAELLPGTQFVLRAEAPLGCAQPSADAGCLTGGPSQAATPEPAKNRPAGARG
jgi:general secretion pathway protein J